MGTSIKVEGLRVSWNGSISMPQRHATSSDLDSLASSVGSDNQTRNGLAYREPVYGSRLDDIFVSRDFVVENLGSRRTSRESPVAKFILPHRERLDTDVVVFRTTFTRLTGGS